MARRLATRLRSIGERRAEVLPKVGEIRPNLRMDLAAVPRCIVLGPGPTASFSRLLIGLGVLCNKIL